MADDKGKVVLTKLSDKMIFSCKVETKEHGEVWPSVFLLEEDGTVNLKSEEYLSKIFGWDGQDPNDLKTLAMGKEVDVYSKTKGQYTNWYFSNGAGAKSVEPGTALEKWRNAKCGISNPAPVAAGGGGWADLSIEPEQIPFAPCIY